MDKFLWGALAMACVSAALLFLRFWRVSGDRLFLYFCLAFGVFSLNWISLAAIDAAEETRYYFYLLRLAAFALIIVGIVDKNRRTVGGRGEPKRPPPPGAPGETGSQV